MLSDESRLEPDAAAVEPNPDRSVATLLSDLATEAGMLVRQEVALFRAEINEKLARLGQGVGALAAGGLIAFSGWLAVLAAAVLGLSQIVAPWLAALIVGLVVLVLGAGLVLFGKNRLDLVPRRSLGSLREEKAWIRDQLP
jgi:hypothetical protein